MVENVKGFEVSEAHDWLLETLEKNNYHYRQLILSPQAFSVPNSRNRYYLIARKCPDSKVANLHGKEIHTRIPVIESLDSIFDSTDIHYVDSLGPCNKVADYLENLTEQEQKNCEISDSVLLRYHMIFDLVDFDSRSTNCFTKAYGHRVEGCGSILKTSTDTTIDEVYSGIEKLKQNSAKDSVIIELLRTLKLRYFSPREIANLMCFPKQLGKKNPNNIY